MGSLTSTASEDQVLVASFKTIDFAALERKDKTEVNKLLQASAGAGFFYLDFAKSGAEGLSDMKKELLETMDSYFLQPTATKMKDSRGISTRGYTHCFPSHQRNDQEQY